MDKEKKAIERIKMASKMSLHHYGKPLVCTYSGGKDSDVMLELFKRAGIPFEVHNSHTTADAPQTIYHIWDVFHGLELQGVKCNIDYHRKPDGGVVTMWNLIPRKLMPPTRIIRYCCRELKETSGKGRFIATGVRWDESNKRKEWGSFSQPDKRIHASDEIMLNSENEISRRVIEHCMQKDKMIVNPIIDWDYCDIWEYIKSEHININCLYKEGFERVGCIGCPMSGKKRWFEFSVFPKYKQAYIKAFDRMLAARTARGLVSNWKTGKEVFLWWMEDKNIPGQMSLDDFPEMKGGLVKSEKKID